MVQFSTLLSLDLNCGDRFANLRASDSQRASMNLEKLVFAQITEHFALTTFRLCVVGYVFPPLTNISV
jgi:hypothetical protein